MAERIVVIGAGGFGRETLDVIEAMISAGAELQVVGVIDAGPRAADLDQLEKRRIAFLGTEEEWLPTASGDEGFVVAVGDPEVRRRIAGRFSDAGFGALTLIHPSAVIGSQAQIGRGVVIAAGVQVSTNVTIGDHVHLNPASVIGHDATLAGFVSVNPGAVVSGNVVVETGVLLGARCVVLQGLRIGTSATVGAAACATKSVSPGTTVVGVPARQVVRTQVAGPS